MTGDEHSDEIEEAFPKSKQIINTHSVSSCRSVLDYDTNPTTAPGIYSQSTR